MCSHLDTAGTVVLRPSCRLFSDGSFMHDIGGWTLCHLCYNDENVCFDKKQVKEADDFRLPFRTAGFIRRLSAAAVGVVFTLLRVAVAGAATGCTVFSFARAATGCTIFSFARAATMIRTIYTAAAAV